MTLFDLKPGENGVLQSFLSECNDTRRLREMGLVEGTPVSVIRYAPFGEPVEISCRGFHLSLDKQMGRRIHVLKSE